MLSRMNNKEQALMIKKISKAKYKRERERV